MENEQDLELKELLQAYKVEDADDALLERIVARAANIHAADTKILSFTPRTPVVYARNAAIAAALAVLGFFSGYYATLPVSESELAAKAEPSSTLDKVILGPKTLNEVSL